jgi:hypothetical protein
MGASFAVVKDQLDVGMSRPGLDASRKPVSVTVWAVARGIGVWLTVRTVFPEDHAAFSPPGEGLIVTVEATNVFIGSLNVTTRAALGST